MSLQPSVITDGPLSVSTERYGAAVLVVSLAGELDQSNVALARKAILGAIEDGDEFLLIDLSDLDFLDSSGIALLLAADEMCPDETKLRIVPSRALGVTRLLRLTGVDSLLAMVEEKPAAA